jgi:hypothetical protein
VGELSVGLCYPSGEAICPGDTVRYHGQTGHIDFVVDGSDPTYDWYFQEQGPGVMVSEPVVFGAVYVTELDDFLEFVSRAEGTR